MRRSRVIVVALLVLVMLVGAGIIVYQSRAKGPDILEIPKDQTMVIALMGKAGTFDTPQYRLKLWYDENHPGDTTFLNIDEGFEGAEKPIEPAFQDGKMELSHGIVIYQTGQVELPPGQNWQVEP